MLSVFAGSALAQSVNDDISEKNLSPMRKVYVGYKVIPDPYNPNETAFEIIMRDVVVYPNERFRNKEEEKFYWRTVRDVKRTLPYAKLINRETNQTSYHIVKAFLGTFRAGFWQTFGRFFGVNLNAAYKPDKDKNDAVIERVATRVEQGLL